MWERDQTEGTAFVVYHEDGYSERIDLEGEDAPAYVRLRPRMETPSVLLQAKDHASYWRGLQARSSPPSRRRSSETTSSRPLLILPDAKQAKVFDQDVMVNSGGCSMVIASSWKAERPGDVLLEMDHRKVKQAWLLIAHSHGYQATSRGRGSVSYPGQNTPTRIAIRLERKGKGSGVELLLGAKDGGTAATASAVKFYELDPSIELQILPRLYMLDVRACKK